MCIAVFKRGLFAGALAVLLLYAGSGLLQAQITLQDGDSTVVINPSSANAVSDWSVGATNYLNQQEFWLGDSGLAQSLGTLALVSTYATNSNEPSDLFNLASLNYDAADGLRINVRYSLEGGEPGSGTSNLGEQVELFNPGASPLTVRFFQYTNAVINPGADTVEFLSPSDQVVVQSSTVGTLESVVTGPLDAHEAGLTTLSPTTVERLQTVSGLALDNASGPFTGDATYAYQWDTTLQPGRSITLGENNQLNVAQGVTPVTPEPGPLSLLAAAVLGLGLFAARRRSR
jgi:MYXO-CTERM domain-containing protein